MQHPIGRHHRRCRSLTEHLWALFALTLASVLAQLFIPNAPKRLALPSGQVEHRSRADDFPSPPTWVSIAQEVSQRWEDDYPDPDQIAGALVRPYLAPLPRPHAPVGDLLADSGKGEFDDLTEAIRTYLRVCA
ncbi:hypothetical protein ACWGSK_15675 [Nocardiopsis sp. NPDC055551]|uniref:hypothetical protein n=1 Tax=Nocardiopsis sp. NPDC006832 TaxID=3157188 RepID=UPI00340CAE31